MSGYDLGFKQKSTGLLYLLAIFNIYWRNINFIGDNELVIGGNQFLLANWKFPMIFSNLDNVEKRLLTESERKWTNISSQIMTSIVSRLKM